MGTHPKNLAGCAERCLVELSLRGRSAETVRYIRKCLRVFLLWCDERSIWHTWELSSPLLQRYQMHLFRRIKRDGGSLSRLSQHKLLSAVRVLCEHLYAREGVGWDFSEDVKLPRLPSKLPQGMLSMEEVARLLAAPRVQTVAGKRDRAILQLLYATAMRAVELVALDVQDINLGSSSVQVAAGPGRRGRRLPFGRAAHQWLTLYIEHSRPYLALEAGDADAALFLSQEGRRLSQGYLEHRLGRYAHQAGVKTEGVFRSIRDTVATQMLEQGCDLRFIQEMLGHMSLRSTLPYLGVTVGSLREVHARTHPAERRARRQGQGAAETPSGRGDER
jgi:integrase/recombinase XerD